MDNVPDDGSGEQVNAVRTQVEEKDVLRVCLTIMTAQHQEIGADLGRGMG